MSDTSIGHVSLQSSLRGRLDSDSGSLPRPLTSFIGRERELAEARRLLLAASPVHCRAVRRFTQVSVAYPASSLTKTNRGRGRPRPGQRVPDIKVLTTKGPSTLFTVLRRGQHVIVATGADPDSALANPALESYRDLFEAVTCGSEPSQALQGTRAGSVFLVRPDGYLAARERPDKPQAVLRYLQELCGSRNRFGDAMAGRDRRAARP